MKKRHLVFASLIRFLLATIVASTVYATDDLELAENLISQNDCENALIILFGSWKSKIGADRKKILLNINFCAEQTQNYPLKEQSEKLLLKLDPNDVAIQIKYLESLFYLSKYKNVLTYSKENKILISFFDYWILRARSFYELNQCDKAISELNLLLSNPKFTRKSEIHYWLGQCHAANENYSDAIESYGRAKIESARPKWLDKSIDEIIPKLIQRNRRLKLLLRLQNMYDTNILRENSKIADSLQLVDLYIDYYLLQKRKKSLNVGLDVNYQDYSNNHNYQTASLATRVGQSITLNDDHRFEYSISTGKILTNGRSDQNYAFASAQWYYQLGKTVELQPTFGYFENLNNSPVKQFSASILFNVYLEQDFFWIGPFYKRSDSPAPEINSTSFAYPVVTKHSVTTRFSQFGLITGFVKSLSENFSLQMQYSVNQTEYASIDLTPFDPTKIAGTFARLDTYQTLKATLNYRYSNEFRFNLSGGASKNETKGFQGFYSISPPNSAYEQLQITLGTTIKWP